MRIIKRLEWHFNILVWLYKISLFERFTKYIKNTSIYFRSGNCWHLNNLLRFQQKFSEKNHFNFFYWAFSLHIKLQIIVCFIAFSFYVCRRLSGFYYHFINNIVLKGIIACKITGEWKTFGNLCFYFVFMLLLYTHQIFNFLLLLPYGSLVQRPTSVRQYFISFPKFIKITNFLIFQNSMFQLMYFNKQVMHS